ncbi:hypothetical protein [Kushneria sp. TE3]|uniref:hypothetical protein n=1 Tax=Kushneria sp. TE3 TaxID=3449832 RepID=UPI003F688F43
MPKTYESFLFLLRQLIGCGLHQRLMARMLEVRHRFFSRLHRFISVFMKNGSLITVSGSAVVAFSERTKPDVGWRDRPLVVFQKVMIEQDAVTIMQEAVRDCAKEPVPLAVAQ